MELIEKIDRLEAGLKESRRENKMIQDKLSIILSHVEDLKGIKSSDLINEKEACSMLKIGKTLFAEVKKKNLLKVKIVGSKHLYSRKEIDSIMSDETKLEQLNTVLKSRNEK